MGNIVELASNNEEPRYYAFPPVRRKGIVYGNERLKDTYVELEQHFRDNWAETESWQHADFDPDFEGGIELESSGATVLMFVARDEEQQVVGYLVYRLGASYLSKSHVRATEEMFYVVPERRGVKGGGVALHLLNYAEKCLIEIGVTMFEQMDKSPLGHANLSKSLEKRGYKAVAVSYIKVIGEDDG
jgi:hypothetical protein